MTTRIWRSYINACLGLLFLSLSMLALAGYKARPWSVHTRDAYAAKLTSEGVTIAVEPLFHDTLAAQVFDKNDMVTRGIMPIAIAIFNDNDFPVQIDGSVVELIHGEDHLRTLEPREVVHRLFSSGSKKAVWVPQPIPRRPSGSKSNVEAFEDFDHKFIGNKTVLPHDKGGGFLYLHIPEPQDIRGYLSKSRIYIPKISRNDTGADMIYFEIELQPAIGANPLK